VRPVERVQVAGTRATQVATNHTQHAEFTAQCWPGHQRAEFCIGQHHARPGVDPSGDILEAHSLSDILSDQLARRPRPFLSYSLLVESFFLPACDGLVGWVLSVGVVGETVGCNSPAALLLGAHHGCCVLSVT
jgi:hypothetical protein